MCASNQKHGKVPDEHIYLCVDKHIIIVEKLRFENLFGFYIKIKYLTTTQKKYNM